jgi:hypothetical protein
MDIKLKRNGIFRARLVACGYRQVPGTDFDESFSAVLDDVSFRIMLIAKLVWDLTCTVVDIEISPQGFQRNIHGSSLMSYD